MESLFDKIHQELDKEYVDPDAISVVLEVLEGQCSLVYTDLLGQNLDDACKVMGDIFNWGKHEESNVRVNRKRIAK